MNRESYDAIAPAWDAARKSFHGREREYLSLFFQGLAAPSRVLDLGCGTGRPMAEYAISQGHAVTGVDQSPKLLALARSRFSQGTWIESRIEDFAPVGRFAGALCWDTLFHIERAQHGPLLQRIARWLEPRGRLMATFGGSEHPAFTDTMFGRPFFYDSHPPQATLELLREAGFEPMVAEFMNLPTGGRDKGRYAVVAQLR